MCDSTTGPAEHPAAGLQEHLANVPIAVLAVDDRLACTFAAGNVTADIVGLGDVVGRGLTELFPNDPPVLEAVTRALEGRASTVVLSRRGRSFEARCSPSGEPRSATVLIMEISEHIAIEHRLQQALQAERARAQADPLTNTLNHAAIIDALRGGLVDDEMPTLVVAMVDVDGLKAVNDSWGHQAGDLVLVRVADALRHGDAIVGRYGGDEFVAILPRAGLREGEWYRDEVLDALERAPLRDPESGTRLPVAITVGLSVYPDEANRAEELIRIADSSMYASRRRRRRALVDHSDERLDSESAARLVGEIVPLLTSIGTREEKLRQVAHLLATGAGYEAVNFEVSGVGPPGPWETTLLRGGNGDVDAWVREQASATNHPLGMLMEERRTPVFIDSLATTELMTERELELVVAAGFRSALIVPMLWHDRLVGMLSVGSKDESGFTAWDAQFLTAVSSQVTAIVFMTTMVEDLRTASLRLRRAHLETVLMLAGAAEAHDQTTGRHLQRVQSLAEAIARELGYDEQQATEVGIAAVLHDIGKIRVPDGILASPGRLNQDDWTLMKQHTDWGGDFLSGREGFQLASIVARCHHERWDGGGYPQGLRAEEIPEAAAITTVADSLDAMTNDRPYRAGRPVAEAISEIAACSGTQFSPRVVAALLRLHRRGGLPIDGSDARRAA